MRGIARAIARRTDGARDERGQTLVEYGLILAVVSLGSMAALGFLSDKLGSLYSQTASSLNAVAATTPGGGAAGCGGGGGTGGGTDFTHPRACSLSLENASGGLVGVPESGDRIVVGFTEPLEPQSVCDLPGGTADDIDWTVSATFTIQDNAGASGVDRFAVTGTGGCSPANLGHIDLGTAGFVLNGNAEFSGSTILWDVSASQLIFTLGTASGSALGPVLVGGPAIYYPNAAMRDINGNLIVGPPAFKAGPHF
jgi:Flp pilus assembly pilin Flp